MRSVDTEGETIDEAIGKALALLDVERDRVAIEILEDASRGLFGFGSRRARIRATVRARFGGSEDVSREAPPTGSGAGGTPPDAAGDAAVARAIDVLQQIVAHLGVTCSIAAAPAPEPGSVVLAMSGDGGGLLIGRRGETLDALEYLVNRIVGRDESRGGPRLVLDVEGYRERRRASLTEMAHRMAEKARATHRPVALNPMSPRDRRTVHLALQSVDGVSTHSEGDGFYRRVLVVPETGRRATGGGADR